MIGKSKPYGGGHAAPTQYLMGNKQRDAPDDLKSHQQICTQLLLAHLVTLPQLYKLE